MELALRLLGIGQLAGGSADDEVITCAYTYTASASVISHVGAKIVLVDCADADGSIETLLALEIEGKSGRNDRK